MNRRVFVLVLALAAAVSPAFAHEGHDHKLLGTLSEVSAGKIVLKAAADGKLSTVAIAAATKITRGKKVLSAADLKVGDKVVVNVGSGKEPLTAKTIQLGAATTTH